MQYSTDALHPEVTHITIAGGNCTCSYVQHAGAWLHILCSMHQAISRTSNEMRTAIQAMDCKQGILVSWTQVKLQAEKGTCPRSLKLRMFMVWPKSKDIR